MTDIHEILICPLCGAQLDRQEGSFFCTGVRRHCYDIAASGYVNLLPPGKKNTARAGDDKDMLRSRSRFLSGGWYNAVSDTAARLGYKAIGNRDAVTFVDAGSGEGYHTCRIAQWFEKQGVSCSGVGIDAAKSGAQAGAKLARAKELDTVQFAAGNIFALPLADESADLVYSIFAPIPGEQAARILKKDGALVVVSAGREHLWEMRCALYGQPRVSEGVQMPAGFTVAERETLSYEIDLPDQETIAALFTMTPFYYRCPREGRDRLLALDKLTVKVEVDFAVLVVDNV